jgi:hypothetical protein
VELPLPWERVLWTGRSVLRPAERYALTDFRLVRLNPAAEIVLQDIGEVSCSRSLIERLTGTATLSVAARSGHRPCLVMRHIRRGQQLAALLEVLAGEVQAPLDARAVEAALHWKPTTRTSRGTPRLLAAALGVVLAVVFAVAAGRRGSAEVATYAADDPIYPGGVRRPQPEIVEFMERTVMPWARRALAPLKGGSDRITCATCHGDEAATRGWQMPAVSALPEPHVKLLGWETYSAGMDTQMRNAIYGYAAESDNQARAAYMREVVMPGMAAILRRPAYDFTKPYNFNRSRLAFGCYHCHRVR